MVMPVPPPPTQPLRIGSRASPLALAQARLAAAAIMAAHQLPPSAVTLVPMVAAGDRIVDVALADIGGKALWTRELDRALAAGEIDIAVHSMKDVESPRPAQFALAALLPRAAVADRLVVRPGLTARTVADLPPGARVGTCSPRRTAQLLALRPDLAIRLLRGNVATRLARLTVDDLDATLLAAAGLDRLGLGDIGVDQPLDDFLPAASQGAIGIECRADDRAMLALVAAADCAATRAAVMAERAFLEALGGTCHSPVAAHAAAAGGLRLRAAIYAADGSRVVRGEAIVDGASGAARLAAELLGQAPANIRALFAR